jgi:alkanesulfonate monooxygenase SsuD/methylene tetrahydromethanopterin reductase-like flavin-dependent oxidoreductase (luciferase family)
MAAAQPGRQTTFDDFVAREIVGTPDECLARLAEVQSWGIGYIRLTFETEASQDAAARLLLPRLGELEEVTSHKA